MAGATPPVGREVLAHVMRIASGGQSRTKCANGGVAPAILTPSGAALDPLSGAALDPPTGAAPDPPSGAALETTAHNA